MLLTAAIFCQKLALRLAMFGVCGLAFAARAAFWTTAYYPGYEQEYTMPASNIDFTAVTHVIHFSLVPNSDGTLDSSGNGITWQYSTNLVALAHAAGVKVLITVGGGSTESPISRLPPARATCPCLSVTLRILLRPGVTMGWTLIGSRVLHLTFSSSPTLVTGLRSALNQLGQPKLLTVAAEAYPPYGDSATARIHHVRRISKPVRPD